MFELDLSLRAADTDPLLIQAFIGDIIDNLQYDHKNKIIFLDNYGLVKTIEKAIEF